MAVSLVVAAERLCRFRLRSRPRLSSQFFENRIRPILSDNCYKCHSVKSEKVKGGLMLDTREGLLKGRRHRPGHCAGDPETQLVDQSRPIHRPGFADAAEGQQLPDSAIADLVAWVKMGAPDPRMRDAGAEDLVGFRARPIGPGSR